MMAARCSMVLRSVSHGERECTYSEAPPNRSVTWRSILRRRGRFTRVIAHFNLDSARIAALWTALGQEEQSEFVVQRFEPARQDARARGPGGEPESRMNCSACRKLIRTGGTAGTGGDARHGEAHHVVAERGAPDFLRDARGCLAAQRLSCSSVRSSLRRSQVPVPSVVVEGDDLGGRIGDGIQQRSEQRLRGREPRWW